MARLTAFLCALYCEAIGQSEFVDSIVNSLGQTCSVLIRRSAAE